jgi:hypothetical protein
MAASRKPSKSFEVIAISDDLLLSIETALAKPYPDPKQLDDLTDLIARVEHIINDPKWIDETARLIQARDFLAKLCADYEKSIHIAEAAINIWKDSVLVCPTPT